MAVNTENVSSLFVKNSVLSKAFAEEIKNGIDTASYPIAGFKVEQKITSLTSSNSLNIGIFANGESNIKQFQTMYLVTMFSNKFNVVKTPDGKEIKKRYAYGCGFTLNISDVKTKTSFNYAIIAASASLDYLNAGYELNVFGITDASLIEHLPANTGDFSAEIYDKLIDFISKAKKHLSVKTINTLYPIEIIVQKNIKSENADTSSIYFGVKKVSEGISLQKTIDHIRANRLKINENIVQFIYKYFGQNNAYTEPGIEQKQNAKKWLGGKYNKVTPSVDNNGHWVAIDPAVENGKFLVFSGMPEANTYQPHPIPANWKELAKKTVDTFTEVSLDFSSNLKLAAIVDTSANFNTITITRDVSWYFDVSENPLPKSQVIETRYGVGLRLTLRVSQIEFGTKVSYATIGAVSELGYANVEYEISGYGISDTSILNDLPGPQTVNENTIQSINKAFTSIMKKLAKIDQEKLNPQPLMIRVSEPREIDPTLETQAMVFSYTQLSERARLGEAVTKATAVGIDAELVRKFYKTFKLTDVKDKPSADDKREALKWLNV